jgi:uncharacterized membrane-anchored protein YjiN (DUF445 family)
MTEVDVDSMIKQHESREKMQNLHESVEMSKMRNHMMPKKKFLIRKSQKPVRTFVPPSMVTNIQNFTRQIETNSKFNNSVKRMCLNVSSTLMKDLGKRDVLKQELANSDILSEYIDDNLCIGYFNDMNQHLKASLEYIRCYLTAYNS